MRYKNTGISSDDPQAIEKLTEKLNACKENQEFMKTVNAYYRKNGTAKGCPGVTDEQAVKMDEAVKTGYSWETAPFPSYKLTNNNQEINRLKKRIESLSKDRSIGYVGWKFAGGEAIANISNNRLQFVFDEKPSAEQRKELKCYGFHWSPSEGAWQRQLNENAIYAANHLEFVKPENGQKPTDLQPKTPKRDEPER